MTIKLYYQAPEDKIFDEVKQEAIKLWQTYDNTYGYVDEKVNQIKDLENIEGNFMYMIAMFDASNQIKLFSKLSKEAINAIKQRLE